MDYLRVRQLETIARDIDDAASALEMALAAAQARDPSPQYWVQHIQGIDALRLMAKIRMEEIISAEIARKEL